MKFKRISLDINACFIVMSGTFIRLFFYRMHFRDVKFQVSDKKCVGESESSIVLLLAQLTSTGSLIELSTHKGHTILRFVGTFYLSIIVECKS